MAIPATLLILYVTVQRIVIVTHHFSEHLVVDLSDRFDVQLIIAPQICGGVLRPIHRVAEATRQLRKLVLIRRQGMSLQMMEDLEPMLNRSKEDVGLRQRGMLLAGQMSPLRQP